ncbi:MAG: gamma-glutamyltransferase [Euryarchaeota archaeon]|nr:gamma-glutamyltransferase [Euryarchaeota archaeon]
MRIVAVLAALLLFAGCFEVRDRDALAPTFGTGVVSTVHPLVSAAGAAMLRQGGNAVDAAAAVQWALNVVEPSMSGLGGGSLILVWLNHSKQFVFYDGREKAPAASTKDQFLLPNGEPMPFAVASTRGYAVGVPGTFKAFDLAVREHGLLPVGETFAPAITLAEGGFTVDRYLAGYVAGSEEKLRSWPSSAKVFIPGSVCPQEPAPIVTGNAMCVGGGPIKEGDKLVQPDLAKTFKTLAASNGTSTFYSGAIAQAIVYAQSLRQGRMVASDLRGYEAKVRAPVEGTFGGLRVVSAPPPSAGGLTMLEMLNILEAAGLDARGDRTVDSLHHVIEAMHLAYQDRYAYIGDQDFVDVPMKGLLSKEFAAERRALISDRANPSPKPGDPWKHEGRPQPGGGVVAPTQAGDHTTHYVVVDGWGNVAAVTTTLESLFGTGIMVPGFGFLLNNQLTDFDFRPGGPNEVAPNKRPRSSMTPTIVVDGDRPVLALGSPGGPTITTTVMQVFLDVAAYDKSAPDAVRAPRIYSSDYPNVIWEAGIGDAVREGLRAKGHTVASNPSRIGNVQAAQWQGSEWVGVADTRAGQGGVEYVAPDDVATRP